jgi:hypothetical protein
MFICPFAAVQTSRSHRGLVVYTRVRLLYDLFSTTPLRAQSGQRRAARAVDYDGSLEGAASREGDL